MGREGSRPAAEVMDLTVSGGAVFRENCGDNPACVFSFNLNTPGNTATTRRKMLSGIAGGADTNGNELRTVFVDSTRLRAPRSQHGGPA